MGILIVSVGSAATGMYFISALYLIFLNPTITFKSLINKTIDLHKQLPILAIFPLFVLTLFAFSIGQNNSDELLETLASHFQLLCIVPVAIGLHSITQNEDFLDLFIKGLRIGIFIIFPIAIIQIIALDLRPQGGSGNSLVFAFVLAIAGALCLLQRDGVPKSNPLFVYGSSICAFSMVFISLSRAPLIIAAILLLIALFYGAKKAMNLRNLLTFSALLIALMSISIAIITSTEFGNKQFNKRILAPIEKITEGKVTDNSFRKRLDLQFSGFQAFINEPLLGHGIQNTLNAANTNSEEALGRKTNYEFSHLHNDYLTYAVAGGVIAFIQFLLVLASPLYINMKSTRIKSSRRMRWFTSLTTLGFCLVALTNVVLGHDIMSTLFSMCVVFILIDYIQRQNSHMNSQQ